MRFHLINFEAARICTSEKNRPINNNYNMDKFKYILESRLFGVCSKLGEKLNFSASSIRVYFIYASFFTLGSPIIIYLFMAFWMEARKHLRRHQNPSVWEL